MSDNNTLTEEEKKRILDEETQKLKQKEQQKLRFDFDQAIAEMESPGEIEIKFNGEIFTLPAEMPGPLLLKVTDNPEDPSVVSEIIGKRLSKEMQKAGIDFYQKQLMELIAWVKRQWGITDAADAKNLLTPDS